MHSIETSVFDHSTHVFNHSTRVFNHSTRVFNHSTCVFKLVVFDHHGFTSVPLSSNLSSMHCEYVTSSDSLLQVLISRYMFTRVCRMHYLSSSNSPLNFRIGKHIHKGRGLILLVMRPAKINYLSANYMISIFANIFHLECSIPFL